MPLWSKKSPKNSSGEFQVFQPLSKQKKSIIYVGHFDTIAQLKQKPYVGTLQSWTLEVNYQ